MKHILDEEQAVNTMEIEANVREAFTLLKLIDRVFCEDSLSVMCFDLRLVDRIHKCVERQKATGEPK